jgi:nucleoside 2-deoxyribosyltransferase
VARDQAKGGSRVKIIFGEQFEERTQTILGTNMVLWRFESTTLGGLSMTMPASVKMNLEEENYKICCVLREYFIRGLNVLICTTTEKASLDAFREAWHIRTVEELLSEFPAGISERVDKILRNIHVLAPSYGTETELPSHYDLFSKTFEEALFIVEVLRDRGLISTNVHRTIAGSGKWTPVSITAAGWERLEQIEAGAGSRQAFVAMSFARELDSAYSAIGKACAPDFAASRVDTKEHNNEIVGEILLEIRRSRFVIADVTGQRQGVYFEAGFAMGIGRPVIWSCREDDFKHVHFDASHFSHVIWSSEADLTEKMAKRIRGTILLLR